MKNLLLVLSLVIVASPAFASRARLESLGEGKNGSYYINDGRNIFLNPAAINSYKKKLWIELGQTTNAVDDLAAVGNHKVQGGFTNSLGDYVYGLYVGRESDRSLSGTTATGQLAVDHAFDFFFGGESGIKWGVDVFYAGAMNRTTALTFTQQTAGYFGFKLGVDVSNFAFFTTVGVSSKAVTDTEVPSAYAELKGKLSLDLGATYTMDNMTYLAKFSSFGSDFTQGTTTTTVTTPKTTAYALGAGWKKEATKAVTMYSRIQLDYQKDTKDVVVGTAASTNLTTDTWYNLPLVLAAEAQATSWLTIRGSLSHSLFGQHSASTPTTSTKDSFNGQTTAALGFGFNFGDLTIDALAGQTTAVANAASESSQGTAQAGSQFGFGTSMLSRLSMTYNF